MSDTPSRGQQRRASLLAALQTPGPNPGNSTHPEATHPTNQTPNTAAVHTGALVPAADPDELLSPQGDELAPETDYDAQYAPEKIHGEDTTESFLEDAALDDAENPEEYDDATYPTAAEDPDGDTAAQVEGDELPDALEPESLPPQSHLKRLLTAGSKRQRAMAITAVAAIAAAGGLWFVTGTNSANTPAPRNPTAEAAVRRQIAETRAAAAAAEKPAEPPAPTVTALPTGQADPTKPAARPEANQLASANTAPTAAPAVTPPATPAPAPTAAAPPQPKPMPTTMIEPVRPERITDNPFKVAAIAPSAPATRIATPPKPQLAPPPTPQQDDEVLQSLQLLGHNVAEPHGALHPAAEIENRLAAASRPQTKGATKALIQDATLSYASQYTVRITRGGKTTTHRLNTAIPGLGVAREVRHNEGAWELITDAGIIRSPRTSQ